MRDFMIRPSEDLSSHYYFYRSTQSLAVLESNPVELQQPYTPTIQPGPSTTTGQLCPSTPRDQSIPSTSRAQDTPSL